MVCLTSVELLRADYPMLARALGDASFDSLAATYLQQANGLPELLSELSVRGDLVDLAALERARALVARLPIESSVKLEGPAKLLPATRRVRLIRSFRLVELSHDAMSVFWQLEEGIAPLPPPMERVFALVWRSPRAVEHTGINAREASIVEMAAAGASISALDHYGGRSLARRMLDALSDGDLLAA